MLETPRSYIGQSAGNPRRYPGGILRDYTWYTRNNYGEEIVQSVYVNMRLVLNVFFIVGK